MRILQSLVFITLLQCMTFACDTDSFDYCLKQPCVKFKKTMILKYKFEASPFEYDPSKYKKDDVVLGFVCSMNINMGLARSIQIQKK